MTSTTPRRINADVFRRARKAGAPLDLAAYVARPPVLDLDWLSHYQSDGEWADFEIDGRRFRATAVDPHTTEGDCVSCAELVDANRRRDEGIAWMTPDEYGQTEHRALTVTVLDDDGEETAHSASLYGVCSTRATEVDRLADDRYLAETVAELASEAAGLAADAETAAAGQVTVTITRDQLEAWAGRPLTADEVAQIDDAIPLSSIPEAIGVIADNLD